MCLPTLFIDRDRRQLLFSFSHEFTPRINICGGDKKARTVLRNRLISCHSETHTPAQDWIRGLAIFSPQFPTLSKATCKIGKIKYSPYINHIVRVRVWAHASSKSHSFACGGENAYAGWCTQIVRHGQRKFAAAAAAISDCQVHAIRLNNAVQREQSYSLNSTL